MVYGEIRWSTAFVSELSRALDEVERSQVPAALTTIGGEEKFYSNGLDLEWLESPADKPQGRALDFSIYGTYGANDHSSVPTLAAGNSQAFGARFMFALSHDYHLMRVDRGCVDANEMQPGTVIPVPERSFLDINCRQICAMNRCNWCGDGRGQGRLMPV